MEFNEDLEMVEDKYHIFIGILSWDITKHQHKRAFGYFGKVIECQVKLIFGVSIPMFVFLRGSWMFVGVFSLKLVIIFFVSMYIRLEIGHSMIFDFLFMNSPVCV